MYRFFVQPQVDQRSRQIVGYEVLLRKHQDHQWVLPQSFSEVSVADQVTLLEQTAAILKIADHQQSLAFNLNNTQFHDPLTLGTIITMRKQLDQVALAIELTEAPKLQEVIAFSTVLHQYGIKLILDDVGTGSNTYDNIRHLLPFVDEIKFAMQNYRMAGTAAKIPFELAFWAKIATTYRLALILEGVETSADQQLAQQFGISLHQGYLYGKPVLPVA